MMSTGQEHSHQRISSIISNRADAQSISGAEELSRADIRGLRPLPASRDASPYSHARIPSIELHTTRSEQDLRPRSADSSIGVFSPTSALRCSASSSASIQQFSSPPGSSAYAPNIGHSPLRSPFLGSPSQSTLENQRPFSAVTSPALHSAFLHESESNCVFVTPPRTGESSLERPSSPASSAAGSVGRGRRSSLGGSQPNSRATSPGKGKHGSRPATPTEGKVVKKKGWISSKPHSRSESASSSAQDPQAWIATPHGRAPHELSYLLRGQPVSHSSLQWKADNNPFHRLLSYGILSGTLSCISSPESPVWVRPSELTPWFFLPRECFPRLFRGDLPLVSGKPAVKISKVQDRIYISICEMYH